VLGLGFFSVAPLAYIARRRRLSGVPVLNLRPAEADGDGVSSTGSD